MATAALIISIASALGAVLAALFAWMQTRHIGAQLRDSRLPTFNTVVEDMGSWYRLRLRLTTPWPLTSMTAHIPDRQPMQFHASQSGVTPGGPSRDADWVETLPLVPGASAVWRVEFGPDRSGGYPQQITLRLDCVGEGHGDRWARVVAVDVPERVAKDHEDRITL